MFVKIKSNVMFRDHGSFGYITDNRNYEYKRIDDIRSDIGERIISESGLVFFSVLNKKSQHLNKLVEKISKILTEIDINILKNDAIEFYNILEQEGFVALGTTRDECEKNDERFSYTKDLKHSHFKKYSNTDSKASLITSQDYLAEHFNNKPQLTNIHIEITGECNERCIHCYIPHENKVNSISANMFKEIINQCIEMKLLHITLSGGEPMLHESFCDFLKICRKNNLSVSVLSNLTLLDDFILEELKKNPLIGIQVSLYSMNHEIHDEITQVKGSFNKTKDAILKLIDNDIPLKISCPILRINKNCYLDVLDWANEKNIQVGTDYVILARYNHSLDNLKYRLSMKEVEFFIEDMAKKNKSYLSDIKIEAEKKKTVSPDDYICSVCNSSICINENGDVYPCAGWQDYTMGNVTHNSLSDIWYSSDKVEYLRNIRKKDFPICLQCDANEYCTMCMVRNANEDIGGNPLIVNDFFCNIAKKYKILADGVH